MSDDLMGLIHRAEQAGCPNMEMCQQVGATCWFVSVMVFLANASRFIDINLYSSQDQRHHLAQVIDFAQRMTACTSEGIGSELQQAAMEGMCQRLPDSLQRILGIYNDILLKVHANYQRAQNLPLEQVTDFGHSQVLLVSIFIDPDLYMYRVVNDKYFSQEIMRNNIDSLVTYFDNTNHYYRALTFKPIDVISITIPGESFSNVNNLLSWHLSKVVSEVDNIILGGTIGIKSYENPPKVKHSISWNWCNTIPDTAYYEDLGFAIQPGQLWNNEQPTNKYPFRLSDSSTRLSVTSQQAFQLVDSYHRMGWGEMSIRQINIVVSARRG